MISQAPAISARSSARPWPFSEEVAITRGKAAGRLAMAFKVPRITRLEDSDDALALTVLSAVLSAIGTMLALNRLPRLHHPLFGVDSFHLASSDKFFLLIYGDDPQFERTAARDFLQGLDCVRVDPVEHTEEPE